MTDAQYLFDLAAKQYNEVADGIEKHFESVANQLRDWIPQAVHPAPPPPPPPKLLPLSLWNSARRWVSRNRAVAVAIAAFFGTGAVLLVAQRVSRTKKRRAKRSKDNARTEVVVLVGSPTSPLVNALSLDLERRGFVVYVVTGSAEDEQHVKAISRIDVLPLTLDLVYPEVARGQLSHFRATLKRSHYASEGAPPHRLSLSGIVLVPDGQSAIGPVSELGAEDWSTALNAKVLNTILTTQFLLPLMTEFGARMLVMTPSLIGSLRIPYHAIDTTVYSAIEAFTTSLSAEMALEGFDVCHFKLGNLDLPSSAGARARKEGESRLKGTAMRRLHEAVFDALHAKHPGRTWHVGRGSLLYDVMGSWLPAGVVGWMIGMQRRKADVVKASSETSDDGHDGLEGSESSVQWEKIEQAV